MTVNSDSEGKKTKLYVRTYLTERVKSPGLLLLGRARKLPWTPRVNRSCSASNPVMLGWNHLQSHEKQGTNKWPFKYQSDPHFRISRKYSLQFVSPLPQFPLLWRQNKPQTHNALLMSQSSVSNLFFTVTFSQKWQFSSVGPVAFNHTALHFRVLFTYRPVGVNGHIMQ